MRLSKDAQRIIVALYLRKRRAKQWLKEINGPSFRYSGLKNDPVAWERYYSHCCSEENSAHNSLEIAKRAAYEIYD
jgi:hypothetical protein